MSRSKYRGVRLGVSELTRTGMKETAMAELARLLRKCLLDRIDPKRVMEEVVQLRQRYKTLQYSFGQGLPAY